MVFKCSGYSDFKITEEGNKVHDVDGDNNLDDVVDDDDDANYDNMDDDNGDNNNGDDKNKRGWRQR